MDIRYLIALTFIKGVGNTSIRGLLSQYKTAENILNHDPSILATIPKIGKLLSKKDIVAMALCRADEEIENAQKGNIKILCLMDDQYPQLLKECPDAPIVLYQRGETNLNFGRYLAIVGTRNITPYGKEQTYNLVADTACLKGTTNIVSGLAYGVDSIAHKAALKESLPTIAVVAHGLDIIYPSRHKALADKIIAEGGSIISEYPLKSRPEAHNFVQRNRIIAGMSNATVIVESAQKGGSLLTAYAANNYNRDVFAFPGRTDDLYSQGCNQLIRNNQAHIITSSADLFYIMDWKNNNNIVQKELFVELTDEEQRVIDLLKHKETSTNELSRQSGIPIQKLISMLVLLEFKGVVASLPGSIYKAR